VVFTLRLSIAPAVGEASRPASSRACITNMVPISRQRPLSRQSWK
jgi:hypothetical protein